MRELQVDSDLHHDLITGRIACATDSSAQLWRGGRGAVTVEGQLQTRELVNSGLRGRLGAADRTNLSG